MARIPNEVIDDIRSHARIEDVIGSYIDVFKRGNSYVAYCPFHDDNDPSLHISVDKQIFKCFSCPAENGSAGDVFRFVQKYKHVEYPEAVKIVADQIGYKYDFGFNKETKVFEETITHKINFDTVAFCKNELNSMDGKRYKDYLLNRHLDEKIIEKFDIGYNPNGDKLFSFLSRKGYKEADIIAANVARLTNNGIRDVFYDRIMIPIHDENGHPIGFTARSIDPNNESKYINSTDTPVFNKSNVIYNLHRAKQAGKEKKYLIIAEGPMDVIAFDRAGLANAVCSLGTSVTKNQLSKLRKYVGTLLLAFDGDKAGQGAIIRTGKLAHEIGFRVEVINNKTDKDPDEIINAYGTAQLTDMVEKPMTWIEFVMMYYQNVYDLNNYNLKKEYSQKVLEEINKLTDNFDRVNYINQLSEITGFSPSLLNPDSQLKVNNVYPNKKKYNKNVVAPIRENINYTGLELAQREILNQMLMTKEASDLYKEKLAKLPDEKMNTLANRIIGYYNQNTRMNISNFVGSISENSIVSLIYEIIDSDMFYNKPSIDFLNDTIIEIEIYQLKEEKGNKKKLRVKLSDPIVQSRICDEEVEIDKQIRALMKKKSKRK